MRLLEIDLKHGFLKHQGIKMNPVLSWLVLNLWTFNHGRFTNRVALLLPWDVLIDVLVSPVKHQLLLLPVVHPHDLFGHFLNDLLEFLQLLRPTKRHFLAWEKEVSVNTWLTITAQLFVVICLSFTCKLSHSWSRAWRFPLSPLLICGKRIKLIRWQTLEMLSWNMLFKFFLVV